MPPNHGSHSDLPPRLGVYVNDVCEDVVQLCYDLDVPYQALLLEPDDELCAQLSLELGQFYAGRGESAAAVGSWKQAVAAAPRSHAAATAARLLNEIRNREVER